MYGSRRSGYAPTVEREVQHEPLVLEGEDAPPHLPAPPLDPYTPEPVARKGEYRAWDVMAYAWIPIAIVVAIILYAAIT
jgi:hypothetical protein